MNTRIDIIAGADGAGKSALIDRLLGSGSAAGEGAAAYCLYGFDEAQTRPFAQWIARARPRRVLLEVPGSTLLKDIPALFAGSLVGTGYPGTPVFVLDGRSFDRDADSGYFSAQTAHASVVFVNRIAGLSAQDKLHVLNRIWEVNRHVHLMVEPLHGIDLWRVLDLPRHSQPETAPEEHFMR